MAPTRTTVLVADDHPVFRDGLVRALQARPEFEIVGEAADGREALEQIRRADAGGRPARRQDAGPRRAAIAHALRRDGVPTRVVLLSAHAPSELIYRAIALGAAAFLSKEASPRRDLRHRRGGRARRDAADAGGPGRARPPDPDARGRATGRCSRRASARCWR